MKAAAGLAGAIEETFGTRAELIEGHDGIYEIAWNDRVIYSNQNSCRNVPTVPEILQEIGKYILPLSEKAIKVTGIFPMIQ